MRLRAGERIIELQKSLKEKNRVLESINSKIQHDLEMAAEIQKSLLPTRAPEVPDIRFEWFFKPCDELAGDIFNVFKLDENHLGMYVLDVSGHGVAAALRSVTLSYLLSPSHMQSGLLLDFPNGSDEPVIVPPAQVVNHLNKQFPLELNTGQFFTILYGILNIPEKTFRYVSAGHPGIILLNGEGVAEVVENATRPVGIAEDYCYEEKVIQLHPGNRMVLYSDGLVEAKNARMEEFGKERLQRIMEEWRHRSLKEAMEAVTNELNRWKEKEHFEDDVTILALEIE
jgi:sigma-B regulation protein RsbU (phosphoserine phosphatase)